MLIDNYGKRTSRAYGSGNGVPFTFWPLVAADALNSLTQTTPAVLTFHDDCNLSLMTMIILETHVTGRFHSRFGPWWLQTVCLVVRKPGTHVTCLWRNGIPFTFFPLVHPTALHKQHTNLSSTWYMLTIHDLTECVQGLEPVRVVDYYWKRTSREDSIHVLAAGAANGVLRHSSFWVLYTRVTLQVFEVSKTSKNSARGFRN